MSGWTLRELLGLLRGGVSALFARHASAQSGMKQLWINFDQSGKEQGDAKIQGKMGYSGSLRGLSETNQRAYGNLLLRIHRRRLQYCEGLAFAPLKELENGKVCSGSLKNATS